MVVTSELTGRDLTVALDSLSEGLCVFDAAERLVVCNRRYAEFYDLPDVLVRPGTLHEELVAYRVINGMRSVGEYEDFRVQHKNLMGERRSATVQVVTGSGRRIAITHHNMKGGGWISTHRDITTEHRQLVELRERDRQLAVQHMRLEAAVDHMGHGLVMFDSDRRLVLTNQNYAALYHLPPELLQPGTPAEDIVTYQRDHCKITSVDSSSDETWVRTLSTGRVPREVVRLVDGLEILIRRYPLPDGGWVSAHEDVTDQRRHHAEIERLARIDTLTGLGNRLAYRRELEALLGADPPAGFALYCIDLDNFKNLNDTLGHSFGDAVLAAFAGRLQGCCGPDATVYRVGGDEFALVLKSEPATMRGTGFASALLARLCQPYMVQRRKIVIGASIGIALAPLDGTVAEDLMVKADLALYRAKSDGRGGFRYFDGAISSVFRRRQNIELGLRHALDADELRLVYQPIFDLEKNRIGGFEALVRWTDRALGVVSPAEFIPIAERCGLISRIGTWVLQQACEEASKWPDDLRIAVNVSTEQLKVDSAAMQVGAALYSTGLAPHRLELEVTETLLLEASAMSVATIRAIKALGVSLALDDFGAGYSSLRYLRDFSFDKIKIDQSLIKPGDETDECPPIFRAVVNLCRELGLRTTAEGIETARQFEFAREAGCAEIQGYLISPPLPASGALNLAKVSTGQAKSRASFPLAG